MAFWPVLAAFATDVPCQVACIVSTSALLSRQIMSPPFHGICHGLFLKVVPGALKQTHAVYSPSCSGTH
jgi:hypothetical protein